MRLFRAPEEWLGSLDAATAASLLTVAADVVLALDRGGAVRDAAFGSDELAAEWQAGWLGRPWVETVTVESRPKVETLLREAAAGGPPRWRHVNHPVPRGPDLPILYATVALGREGRVVAVGRDLRATAALQQRLVEAQQAMERDYARLRHAETRYRLLFQAMAEPVLIVDAASRKVAEANPAASQLFGEGTRIVDRPFPEGFDEEGTAALQTLLARVRATGRPGEVRARLAGGAADLVVAVSLFRQDGAALLLVRLLAADGPAGVPAASPLLELAAAAPDGLVVTDRRGRIVGANGAFLELAQLTTEQQAQGEPLDRWLGRPGVDLDVLVANLRQHGAVRLFATVVRGEHGASAKVEASAVALGGREAAFGFVVRDVGRRLAPEPVAGRVLPRSVEQLTEVVGRVPLKDIVRETTDVIERLCIEAALELTRDNRASAADLLGLSRQSLYTKLRRYGLGDLPPEGGE